MPYIHIDEDVWVDLDDVVDPSTVEETAAFVRALEAVQDDLKHDRLPSERQLDDLRYEANRLLALLERKPLPARPSIALTESFLVWPEHMRGRAA